MQQQYLVKRWLGGSNKGMVEITAKIQASRLRREQPDLEWIISCIEGLDGRYEVQGYARKPNPVPGVEGHE